MLVLEDLMLNVRKDKFLLCVAVLGFLGFLLMGLDERPGIGIIEVKQYGYPLVWRITDLNAPTQIFCFLVTLSTVGLLLLYSNGLRKKLQNILPSRIFKKVPP